MAVLRFALLKMAESLVAPRHQVGLSPYTQKSPPKHGSRPFAHAKQPSPNQRASLATLAKVPSTESLKSVSVLPALTHSKVGKLALKGRVKPQHNIVLRYPTIYQFISNAALSAVVLNPNFAVLNIHLNSAFQVANSSFYFRAFCLSYYNFLRMGN